VPHHPNNSRSALRRRINEIRGFFGDRLAVIRDVRRRRAAAFAAHTASEQALKDQLAEIAQQYSADSDARVARRSELIAAFQQQRDGLRAEIGALQVQLEAKLAELADCDARARAVSRAADTVAHVQQSEAFEARTQCEVALKKLRTTFAPTRREWRDRLAEFQDGVTRRKRAELAKLERRLAEKEARAARAGRPLRAKDIMYGGADVIAKSGEVKRGS
jgi:hypothetical protein